MAYYRNLREHLQALDRAGKLVRIKRLINKDTELMPLVRIQFRGLPEEERRAFLFEQVTNSKGQRFGLPVTVGTLAASRQIYALGMMCQPQEITERWTQALLHPIPPRLVDSGPIQEVIIKGDELQQPGGGLERLPIPIATPGFDNAPYTSSSHWVTKDPDSGIRNVGNYRAQIKGRTRMGINFGGRQHIGMHWERCRAKGMPLEGALVIGATPNLAFTAVAKIPYGVDEYAVSGGIAGEPMELVKCQTVDLEVPAQAEIVIEGRFLTEWLEPEGPHGEYAGFMGVRRLESVFEVSCITMRRDAICNVIMSQFPPSESSKIRQIAYESVYYKFLKYDCNIPAVRQVAFHESSGSTMYCVIQMKKTLPSQPWQALYGVATLEPQTGKIIITVDEDIDPHDPDAVNWALSFRIQPHRDTRIIGNKNSGGSLDYSIASPDEMPLRRLALGKGPAGASAQIIDISALLIDATCKWPYPPVSLPQRQYMEQALKIWEEEGLPAVRLKSPWYGYSLGWWTEEDEEEARLAVAGEYFQTGEKLAKQREKA